MSGQQKGGENSSKNSDKRLKNNKENLALMSIFDLVKLTLNEYVEISTDEHGNERRRKKGGKAFLMNLAQTEPKTFAGLLGKMLSIEAAQQQQSGAQTIHIRNFIAEARQEAMNRHPITIDAAKEHAFEIEEISTDD